MSRLSVSRIVAAALVALVVSAGLLFTACSSTGMKSKDASAGSCPLCGEATTETAVKDLAYTKCVCPDCKTVSTIDPFAPSSMRDYVGPEAMYVHVCDECDCMVAVCPACRQ